MDLESGYTMTEVIMKENGCTIKNMDKVNMSLVISIDMEYGKMIDISQYSIQL